MFERILVVLENIKNEQSLCQAALKLSGETGARVQWMHLLNRQQPADFGPLRFLHQEALLLYGVESDITQLAGDLATMIRGQLVKWCPDLLMISQSHLSEIAPLFSDKKPQPGRHEFSCSVMIVPDDVESEQPTASPGSVEEKVLMLV
jgi:hypothetical protein